jgi:hypothetical protein
MSRRLERRNLDSHRLQPLLLGAAVLDDLGRKLDARPPIDGTRRDRAHHLREAAFAEQVSEIVARLGDRGGVPLRCELCTLHCGVIETFGMWRMAGLPSIA